MTQRERALEEALNLVLETERTRRAYPAGGAAAFGPSPGEWQRIVTAATAALSAPTTPSPCCVAVRTEERERCARIADSEAEANATIAASNWSDESECAEVRVELAKNIAAQIRALPADKETK